MATGRSQSALTGVDWWLVGLTAFLFFILPVPHTISLRNGILLVLLGTLLHRIVRKGERPSVVLHPGWRQLVVVLAALTGWLLLQALFISDYTDWALHEIKGQWITAMVAFVTASLLGLYALQRGRRFQRALFVAFFAALLVHILYIDLYALVEYFRKGVWISRFPGLAEGPHNANYLTNMMFVLLAAEVVYRYRVHRSMLSVGNPMLGVLFVLTGLSSIFEGMRNGEITVLNIALLGMFLAVHNNRALSRPRKWLIALMLLLVFSIPAAYSLKHDKRWQTLMETLPVALDTEHNKSWLNYKKYPRPTLPNGRAVDFSNYLRIAFAKEGVLMMIEHPFGIGYGREAFAHGLIPKYGEHALWHSHSGLLEMAIGAGFPGLVLWLLFAGLLLVHAYRRFRDRGSFPALFLLLYVTCFFTRSIVDFNSKNHVLMTFFILVGLSLMLMFHDREAPVDPHS